jgi:hypothetical protein
MWGAVFREDGASGSVDAGPARLRLLIALFPASMTTQESLQGSVTHCEPVHTVIPRLWSFRGIIEAPSKRFRAQVLRMHSTHHSHEGLPPCLPGWYGLLGRWCRCRCMGRGCRYRGILCNNLRGARQDGVTDS